MWAATGPGRGLVVLDVRVGWWVWMVVRFVCVIRVIRVPVCPVCVPAPPSVFLPLPVDARLSPFISRSSGTRRRRSTQYMYSLPHV